MTSLTNLVSNLRSGKLQLRDYYRDLEILFESREPSILAFVPEENRFDRLRDEAQALLDQYPDPEQRPPLFGVPIGVKDIFHVDGFVTGGGTKVPDEAIQSDEESVAVSLLKAAGALIMGKTVTTEFAYFAPGATMNPNNKAHTPGGSSSGSAAAVGAGFCPLTLGTQTIGSINRPAAYCGVPGWKPSYERVSRKGVIPLAPAFDHIGLFAPSISGIAHAAAVIVSDWDAIEVNQAQDEQALPVLGIPKGPYLARADSEGLAQFEVDCTRLSEAGYIVKPLEMFADFDEIYDRHQMLMAAEALSVHHAWYAAYGEHYHWKTIELLSRGRDVSAETQARIKLNQLELRQTIQDKMAEHEIDLWITPSACGPAPKGLDSTGDPVMQLPWTQAGLPIVNVPSGRNDDNLPFGLQAIAGWYKDEQLMVWGAGIEHALA